MSKKKWYEKLHSFRLTKEDVELYHFLNELPNNKKSETIRNMLLYAMEHMEEMNTYQRGNLKEVMHELNDIKRQLTVNTQKNDEIIEKINKGVVIQKGEKNIDDVEEQEEQMEESTKDTVDAMLSLFGVDF